MDVRHFKNGKLVQVVDAGAAEVKSNDLPTVESVVEERAFTVISVGNCPQCEELAATLGAHGVPSSVFVKWDRQRDDYAALKASLAMHAGEVFSFPQVFLGGKYQGGFKEVTEKIERGVFDAFFEQEFDAQPKTLQRMVDKRALLVLSLPNCPQCDQLREDLERRHVPVDQVFVKLDKALPEYPSMKTQLQRLIGRDQFAFPQTFARGVYQGSFDEVLAKAEKGEFAELFAEAFGIASPEVKQPAQSAPAISFDDDF